MDGDTLVLKPGLALVSGQVFKYRWAFLICKMVIITYTPKIVLKIKQKICKNVFSKCWLFLQLSALSTVSSCLTFTINICHLTILTKATSKQQVRMMRVGCFFFFLFWPYLCFRNLSLLSSLSLSSAFPFPSHLSLIHLFSLSLPPSLPPFYPVWFLGLMTFQYVTLLNKVLNILQVS